MTQPTAELHPSFSEPEATPPDWGVVAEALEAAELYWLTTVRPDGRPHTTPLIGLWHDGAAWFCTGPGEQKAHNLAGNPHVTVTTGCNTLREGHDVVVEGDAERVSDDVVLERIAELYVAK